MLSFRYDNIALRRRRKRPHATAAALGWQASHLWQIWSRKSSPASSMVQGPGEGTVQGSARRHDFRSCIRIGIQDREGCLEALTCQTRTETHVAATATTSMGTTLHNSVEVRHGSSIHRRSCFTKSAESFGENSNSLMLMPNTYRN